MSDKINDGGPAYPIHTPENHRSNAYTDYGMTMRDFFAGQALQCLRVTVESVQAYENNFTIFPDQVARHAYEIADAMIAERSK